MFEKKSRLKPQNPKDDREDPKELDNGESNQESKLKRGIKKYQQSLPSKLALPHNIRISIDGGYHSYILGYAIRHF